MSKKQNSKELRTKKEKTPRQKRVGRLIIGVILIAAAIILFLGLINSAGPVGQYLAKGIKAVLGQVGWLLPVILIILVYYLLNLEPTDRLSVSQWLGLLLLILASAGVFHLFFLEDKAALHENRGSGYLGYSLAYLANSIFGFWASLVIFWALLIISLILVLTNLPKSSRIEEEKTPSPKIWSRIKSIFVKKKELALRPEVLPMQPVEKTSEEPSEISEEDRRRIIKKQGQLPIVSYRQVRKKIELPPDLLESSSTKPNSGDIKANKLIIQKTLENFDIPVEMGEIKVGPTVTQYTLKPADGIKLSQITSLHNDLALALASHPIRIEAPIPGQSLVGIEVPNQAVAVVRLREVLENEKFKKRKSNLTIGLGKDVAGNIWLADLGKMPHLLVAGATGSGKTVMLNSIIVSLLYQNHPDELKFILIDPKRVELTLYNDLPHLLAPVITDVQKTVNALKWALNEMDRRFDIMAEAKKRDIETYNREMPEKMPYVVIIIDELADLMVAAPQEIETCIIRLAQMARATGIHLCVATQRPSVDIITGLIKANITSRVAFSVASMVDSRTILDFSGAEKLLGRGDMLFISPELSKPKRLQGAFVSDQEIKRIVDYLRNIQEPSYQKEITEFQAGNQEEFGDLVDDELLPQAREVIMQIGRASASLLQRRLRIGYARAARLLDLLEEEGTIGPADGAKPREILKRPEE